MSAGSACGPSEAPEESLAKPGRRARASGGSLEPARGGGAPTRSKRTFPASSDERLRPERGAGGKPGEAGPPSESEREWGPREQ
jgi:hypothetical protein